MGARRNWKGNIRKIVAEIWCYFPELYRMTNVQEDRTEHELKINFPLRFFYVNLKYLSKFQILIDL